MPYSSLRRMSVPRSHIVDCQIQVRRYVLVANPSRWSQKGRVVVQSPMLDIAKAVLRIPVRRYNGEEENSVCLMPTEDIEKDSSIAFKQSQVDTKPFSADAHGVALFDCPPSDTFKYRRGDKFWISIGSDFKEYTMTVPVINLQTYQTGIISIDQVCWYPKIQGPENELWTPGGGLRSQKLEGSKRFAYYSYVIRQRLPGPSTGDEGLTSSAESVLLYSPVRGSKVQNTQHLSLEESQNLFRKRLLFMESSLQAMIAQSSPAEKQLAVSPASLPTPPSSPELDHLRRRLSEVQTLRLHASNGKRSSPRSQGLWNGILNILPAHSGRYVSRSDVIHAIPTHPRPFLETRCEGSRNYSQASSRMSANDEIDLESDDFTACTSPSETSLLSQFLNPYSGDFDARLVGAQLLLEIFNDSKVRPAVSVTCPAISQKTYSIRERWQKNESQKNPAFMDLCDQGDYDCPYNVLFRCRHFHPLPSKCLFGISSSLSAAMNLSHNTNNEDGDLVHEHCISRLAPYPAGAGECMLSNIPLRNHTCCSWSPANLEGRSTLHKRPYQAMDEQSRKILRTQDRRGLIDTRLEMRQSVSLGDCHGFDEEGMKLFREDIGPRVSSELGMELGEMRDIAGEDCGELEILLYEGLELASHGVVYP